MQRKRPPIEFWLWLAIIGMVGLMFSALSLAPHVSGNKDANALLIRSR